jgi:hypothetical protein
MKRNLLLDFILLLLFTNCNAQIWKLSINKIAETNQSFIFNLTLENESDSFLILPFVPNSYAFKKNFINNLYYEIDKNKKSAKYYLTVSDSSSYQPLFYYAVKPAENITFDIELRKSMYHTNYYFCPYIGFVMRDSAFIEAKYLSKPPKGFKPECHCLLLFSNNN